MVVSLRRQVLMKNLKFQGPAIVFESQDTAVEGILGGKK
ncbi:dihydroxy-acid dehydratase [Vibrio chagasii]|nr:dihydroxy-acid dehydratase [Vibrio chagasii]